MKSSEPATELGDWPQLDERMVLNEHTARRPAIYMDVIGKFRSKFG